MTEKEYENSEAKKFIDRMTEDIFGKQSTCVFLANLCRKCIKEKYGIAHLNTHTLGGICSKCGSATSILENIYPSN